MDNATSVGDNPTEGTSVEKRVVISIPEEVRLVEEVRPAEETGPVESVGAREAVETGEDVGVDEAVGTGEVQNDRETEQTDAHVEDTDTSVDAGMEIGDVDYTDDDDDDDYSDDEEEALYPFVCGICDYRFNRIDLYYRHFQLHSDMVTEEFFHPCLVEDGEVKNSQKGADDDDTRQFYTCSVCSVEFPTLCSLHNHLCRNESTKMYIIDIEERKAIPKGKKCVGSVLSGTDEVENQEGAGILQKSEAEEIYDDDNEEEMVSGDESSEPANSQTTDVPKMAEAGSQTPYSKTSKKAGIQRITVKYGDKNETYEVDPNKKRDNGEKDGGTIGSESEADMDMSDVDDHSYNETQVNKKRIKRETDDYFFNEYEGDKVRGRLIKFESPDEMKELSETAKTVGGEGDNKKMICPVCEKIVLYNYLIKHIKKCHADERLPCDICGKVFANKGYLKDHKRFVHEGMRRKSIKGDDASPRPSKYEGLKIYGEEDGPNTKVYCPQCDKIMLRHYLPKHIQKVHSEKNVECDLCGRLFTNRGYLADHKRYMHEGKRKRSVMLRSKNPAIQALVGIENAEEANQAKNRVKCPKCPKIILEEYLSKHIRQAHSDLEYPCDVCGKIFTCQRFLNDHKRCVHTEYDTQCEVCLKMFKGKSAKEKHKKTVHSEALPHECPHCGKRYRSNVEFSRHMSSHNDMNIYCYQCPRCERRFKSQKAMNYHDRSVHKRMGRLQCKWPGCGRILNDRASFKKHYLIHTGDRPNKCPHCERAFIQRVALKYHLRREHNVHELPPGQIAHHRRDSDLVKIEPEDHAVPVPLYVQDNANHPDISEMEVVQAISDAATVDISDSAIVSDLIQIAQSSDGAVVPEALQHVFDGNNKTIVIYYQ
ncbi:hypothetical protein ACF0H5_018026 [Mactra antiquata]